MNVGIGKVPNYIKGIRDICIGTFKVRNYYISNQYINQAPLMVIASAYLFRLSCMGLYFWCASLGVSLYFWCYKLELVILKLVIFAKK